jgi:hypothetical protein
MKELAERRRWLSAHPPRHKGEHTNVELKDWFRTPAQWFCKDCNTYFYCEPIPIIQEDE